MLVRFHILLIACGILFCAGFGLLQLYRDGELRLAAAAAAMGALSLSVYLYRVLRYGVRG